MVYILGDVLTRIKLAQKLRRGSVEVRSSRLVLEVLRIMYIQGAISGFTIVTKRSEVKVIIYLKYHEGLAVIKGLHLVSTPGYRKYLTIGEFLRRYFKGSSQGFYILSTPQGLISSLQLFVNTNTNLKVTGEVLLRVIY